MHSSLGLVDKVAEGVDLQGAVEICRQTEVKVRRVRGVRDGVRDQGQGRGQRELLIMMDSGLLLKLSVKPVAE